MNTPKKKTKIIATLGPASDTYEKIKELVLAGANVFRLNTSHGTFCEHREKIDIIHKIEKELNIFLPVIVDLQGPKIRVANLDSPINLTENEKVIVKHGSATNGTIVPVDYEGIANDVKIDDVILLDDGKIRLQVVGVKNDEVICTVLNGGLLKSRKGLNIPGTTASLAALSPRDIEFIKFAVENECAYIAQSFVRNKDDIILAKKYIEKLKGNIPIIAKIEKPQAVENIDEIIDCAAGIMVARGDLGIEITPSKVPIVQKEIINKSNRKRKVVIVATQMLESMIEQPIPTRAEASDIANAIIDGADAIMLSGETSVGAHSAEAVSMMSSIAKNVEDSAFCNYNVELPILDEFRISSQALGSSAITLAKNVRAKMILAFTHTGYSPRLLSKLRPDIPVVIISDLKSTCQRLNLYWNLRPVQKDWDIELTHELLNEIDRYLLKNTTLKKDDRVIFMGAIPHLITGHTNFLRVHRIGAAKLHQD